MTDPKNPGDLNADLAHDEPREDEDGNSSLVLEFFLFLKENKKWWLIPLILMFLLLGLLILVGSNPAVAPFLYTVL
jgi:hypothetical protein